MGRLSARRARAIRTGIDMARAVRDFNRTVWFMEPNVTEGMNLTTNFRQFCERSLILQPLARAAYDRTRAVTTKGKP